VTPREKELLRAIPEADMINAMVGGMGQWLAARPAAACTA
jgi:hypothetical protein